jgi:hypothetical protein
VFPENFHYPVRQLGVDISTDVHPGLRGRESVAAAGVVGVDGTLFPDWVVTDKPHWIDLPKPDTRTLRDDPATVAELRRRREAFDMRAQFAFRRLAVNADGITRWAGPAYCDKTRRPTAQCVNWSRSRRVGQHIPMTPCQKGSGCRCGATITLAADELARTKQLHPWQSTAWFRDFSRRSAVEAPYALLKHHLLSVGRHYTRVFGLTKTTFFIAAAIVAMNLEAAGTYRINHGLPDPWCDGGTPECTPKQRGPRRDRARRFADLPPP